MATNVEKAVLIEDFALHPVRQIFLAYHAYDSGEIKRIDLRVYFALIEMVKTRSFEPDRKPNYSYREIKQRVTGMGAVNRCAEVNGLDKIRASIKRLVKAGLIEYETNKITFNHEHDYVGDLTGFYELCEYTFRADITCDYPYGRELHIPREALRYLALANRGEIVAMIDHMVRGLFRKPKGWDKENKKKTYEWSNVGSVKNDITAKKFNVRKETLQRGRASMITKGWVTVKKKRKNDAWIYEINTEWTIKGIPEQPTDPDPTKPPKIKTDKKDEASSNIIEFPTSKKLSTKTNKPKEENRGADKVINNILLFPKPKNAPPQSEFTPKKSPPIDKPDLPVGEFLSNPDLLHPEDSGLQNGRKPKHRNVKFHDLEDYTRLHSLFKQAVRKLPHLQYTQQWWLRFAGFAHRAKRVARQEVGEEYRRKNKNLRCKKTRAEFEEAVKRSSIRLFCNYRNQEKHLRKECLSEQALTYLQITKAIEKQLKKEKKTVSKRELNFMFFEKTGWSPEAIFAINDEIESCKADKEKYVDMWELVSEAEIIEVSRMIRQSLETFTKQGQHKQRLSYEASTLRNATKVLEQRGIPHRRVRAIIKSQLGWSFEKIKVLQSEIEDQRRGQNTIVSLSSVLDKLCDHYEKIETPDKIKVVGSDTSMKTRAQQEETRAIEKRVDCFTFVESAG